MPVTLLSVTMYQVQYDRVMGPNVSAFPSSRSSWLSSEFRRTGGGGFFSNTWLVSPSSLLASFSRGCFQHVDSGPFLLCHVKIRTHTRT